MKLIGDVKGKIALIPDDMVTTCGTLVKAAEMLVQDGAREVYACATHGVLSGTRMPYLTNLRLRNFSSQIPYRRTGNFLRRSRSFQWQAYSVKLLGGSKKGNH